MVLRALFHLREPSIKVLEDNPQEIIKCWCRGHPTPTKSLGHVICDHEVEMSRSRRDDIKSCFIVFSVLIFDSVGLQ